MPRTEQVSAAILAIHKGQPFDLAVEKLNHAQLIEFMQRYPFSYEDSDKRAIVEALLRKTA